MKVEKIKEKFVEVTIEEQHKLYCLYKFESIDRISNYKKLVNTPIRKNEFGYMYKNKVRIRYLVREPKYILGVRRKEMAVFFKKRYDEFIPFWKIPKAKKTLVGMMFGCEVYIK